jgi:hypothetical protein
VSGHGAFSNIAGKEMNEEIKKSPSALDKRAKARQIVTDREKETGGYLRQREKKM